MTETGKIDYLEIPTRNLEVTKKFFSEVFGWAFVDYGPEYSCFKEAGMNGGFYKAESNATVATGSVLIVLYSSELETTQAQVEQAGGSIVKPIFTFPGGRRFHFADPNGNEYAVWSE